MVQSKTTRSNDSAYALGHSAGELERLIEQARFLGDLTEHVLRLAGLAPGMRVLDVGCGAGDVSFLAVQMVGPEGTVIGVDKSPDAIAVARERARAAGLDNVQFVVQDAAELTLEAPVDAMIGRLVLMYCPEPAAVLRHLLAYLRPGGIAAFQELDTLAATSEPRCATYETATERIRQTFARAGNELRAGLKLRRIFLDAGLPAPDMFQAARVESGPDSPIYAHVEQITRSLLPLMERTRVASADDARVETLAERLRAEAVEQDAVLVFPPLIGAWTRKDASMVGE